MLHQEHIMEDSGLPALYLNLHHSLCWIWNAETNTFTSPSPLAHLIYYHFDHKVSSSDTCWKWGTFTGIRSKGNNQLFKSTAANWQAAMSAYHLFFPTAIRNGETGDAWAITEDDIKPKSSWWIFCFAGIHCDGRFNTLNLNELAEGEVLASLFDAWLISLYLIQSFQAQAFNACLE